MANHQNLCGWFTLFLSGDGFDPELASQIPYPKEKPSLPAIVSREELKFFFDGCSNPKHKVMFRLMYSAGLRRGELVKLKITAIETQDGKMRTRINKGKGGKDRYIILSKTILEELRVYFFSAKPKVYLFNGQTKGQPAPQQCSTCTKKRTQKQWIETVY